jgi:heterodisulfide reductase subunit A
MVKGKVAIEPIIATTDLDVCGGCEVCIELCPYGAIERADEQVSVNVALCKGCGTCVAACPSGAMDQQHFKTEQIFAQIEAAINEPSK